MTCLDQKQHDIFVDIYLTEIAGKDSPLQWPVEAQSFREAWSQTGGSTKERHAGGPQSAKTFCRSAETKCLGRSKKGPIDLGIAARHIEIYYYDLLIYCISSPLIGAEGRARSPRTATPLQLWQPVCAGETKLWMWQKMELPILSEMVWCLQIPVKLKEFEEIGA